LATGDASSATAVDASSCEYSEHVAAAGGRYASRPAVAAAHRDGSCGSGRDVLPAWWSARRWLDVDVWCRLTGRPDWCLEAQVAPATAARVARAHAVYADQATGRGCRPTNERLARDTGLHVRTVQRARELLKRLGLVVELVPGRSRLSRGERLQAWRGGSGRRRIAAEFALVAHRPGRSCVKIATPPRRGSSCGSASLNPGFSPSKDDQSARPAAGARPKQRRPPPRRPLEARHLRLLAGVQSRIAWLARTPARRLTSLRRFAAAGWTPRDVQKAADAAMAARGWSLPDRIEQPAAYLATLLRDADPAARPGALEAAALLQERQRRAREWARITGELAQCPHGDPGGDQPHPTTGRLTCPLCRRAAVRAPP
jgi:hypothetical protein